MGAAREGKEGKTKENGGEPGGEATRSGEQTGSGWEDGHERLVELQGIGRWVEIRGRGHKRLVGGVVRYGAKFIADWGAGLTRLQQIDEQPEQCKNLQAMGS